MKKVDETVQHLDPIVVERKLWNLSYLFFAMIIGFIIVVSILVILYLFDLSFMSAITMVSIFVAFYAMFLFFLIEPRLLREIQHSSIKTETYERPVFQDVVREVEKPVIKEVIKEVEKPVIKEVIREVNKPVYRDVPKTVYVEQPRKKLNIPRYNYFGSSETKIYHARKCRFRKLIKRKYLVTSNTPTYFINRNFKPCKVCLPSVKVKKGVSKKPKSRAVKIRDSKKVKNSSKNSYTTTFSSRAALLRKSDSIDAQIAKNTGTLNQMMAKMDKASETSNKKVDKVSKQVKGVSLKVDENSKKSSKKMANHLKKVSSQVNKVSRVIKKSSN